MFNFRMCKVFILMYAEILYFLFLLKLLYYGGNVEFDFVLVLVFNGLRGKYQKCTCLNGINSLRLIKFNEIVIDVNIRCNLSVVQTQNEKERNLKQNGFIKLKKLYIVVHKIVNDFQDRKFWQDYFVVFRIHRTFLIKKLFLLFLLSSICQISSSSSGNNVKYGTNVVKTKYGLLRGIVFKSPPSVEAYLGIPYASPPVGSLRFMPPITPSSWKTIKTADRFSPVCPQSVPIPPNGPEALLEVPRARLAQLRRLLPLLKNQSEDCLYLNIYVPFEYKGGSRKSEDDDKPTSRRNEGNEESKPLSTILFIHGESYDWNSGNPYDGSELAAHGNVIVVTINFRLGIFGFLKTGGKESAQGNFGLMDLVAGLHWLKENLPAFGGDPQGITILGHGCGAALANILAVSPVASDLLQRAVLVSGSALSPWAIQKDPLLVKRRVAEQTGCHGDLLYDDIAPCLRTKSVAELLSVKINHPRFLVGFAPFIDGTVISPKIDGIGPLTLPLGSTIISLADYDDYGVLCDVTSDFNFGFASTVNEILQNTEIMSKFQGLILSTSGIEFANFPKRDLIFGLTSVESYLDLSAQDLEFGFNETRRDRILRTYVRNIFHYHLNEIFAVLKNEYTDWEKVVRNPFSCRDATLSFLSDGHTASSLVKLGYMHSLRGGRTYFVHFKLKTVEEDYPQRTGSIRGEDIPFWLGLPSSPLFPHNYTSQEKQISHLMLKYLSNFAKTGNPNQYLPWLYKSNSEIKLNQNIYQNFDDNLFATNISKDNKTIFKKRSATLLSHPKTRRQSTNRAMSQKVEKDKNSESQATIESNSKKLMLLKSKLYYKRHLRSNDNSMGERNSENIEGNLNSELPFWDAYDSVNQLYLELNRNNAEIRTHYRGHKLSMWLNLIPQLHEHFNLNDLSVRHHQFAEEHMQYYDGIVRPQLQVIPMNTDETPKINSAIAVHTNKNQNSSGNEIGMARFTTTECVINETLYLPDALTPSTYNNSSEDYHQFKNLEVLRRLSGKQFQSYTTALVATIAVGCFLLVLNILIFAAIYHQREKRVRDTKTKEELQDDNNCSEQSRARKLSKNSSNVLQSSCSRATFGEYSCYDEKTLLSKQTTNLSNSHVLFDANMKASSTTLDLLKTNIPSEGAAFVTEPDINMYYKDVENGSKLYNASENLNMRSLQNSFDYTKLSSQISFKEIENAVKISSTHDYNDIPEPPPPPKSAPQCKGGILRQAGGNVTFTPSKKRVHIQEISV